MKKASDSPLASIEPRLRPLLPANLYADVWLDPSPEQLKVVFEHLGRLNRALVDYIPRQVVEMPPAPGEVRHEWQTGTLMFTDLAGFTSLLEANAARGRSGADTLLKVLNNYFAGSLEIISKAGGNLLEFTGDALLAEFKSDKRQLDTVQAVRAGLRMQRNMAQFAKIVTDQGEFSLRMRVGIHTGRFLTADIGTPRRMDHVLLGDTVHQTKHAEGAGQAGWVNLTETAMKNVQNHFRLKPGKELGYFLVDDDLGDDLGDSDFSLPTHRLGSAILLDRSVEGIISEITGLLKSVEALACFLPVPILNLLVENAARREIPSDFPAPTVMFVNLIGLSECVDHANEEERDNLIAAFSRAFTLINATVEARGGVLKKVTYHLNGSDMMMYFGAPQSHSDDPIRAALAALAIRDIIAGLAPVVVGGMKVKVTCKIGLACGSVFAAQIGDRRSRREYNILGDTVNTAARLMGRAEDGQILMTEGVHNFIYESFECEALGMIPLKGKTISIPIYSLKSNPDKKR